MTEVPVTEAAKNRSPHGGRAILSRYAAVLDTVAQASRGLTLAEIGEVHALIRETLAAQFGAQANETRILYGGSVGPKNAGEIFTVPGVDGALVGRASLKAADFSAIILGHPAAV